MMNIALQSFIATMFVLMPIAAAYEEYGNEVMKRIVANGYDACYDNDYLVALNRRIKHYWNQCVVIVGNTNMVGRTVVVRIPSCDSITEYPLDTFLHSLGEIRSHH